MIIRNRPKRGRQLGGGGGPSPVDPLLNTTKVWVTSSSTYCFEDSGGLDPCENGDLVQVIINRGTAGNLEQTEAGKRYGFILSGGRLGITGDGTDKWMDMPAVNLSAGWSCFMAHATTGDVGLFGADTTTRPQIRIGISGANALTAVCDETGSDIATSATLSTARGQPTVSGWVYDPAGGGTVTFYENGAQVGTPVALTGGYVTAPAVNRFGGLRTFPSAIIPLNGPVYEYTLDNTIFLPARALATMAYLKTEWNTP